MTTNVSSVTDMNTNPPGDFDDVELVIPPGDVNDIKLALPLHGGNCSTSEPTESMENAEMLSKGEFRSRHFD
jgi:hypothetical protein